MGGDRYFCPFAQALCFWGAVNTKTGNEKCRFWAEQPRRCWLLPAVAGLTDLSQIVSELHSLGSRLESSDKFR